LASERPADRQGITEIRYVEGLYATWDELRARFPQMYLDDCASGGRRIDLEMVMRSVVQTRSDSACAPGRADWTRRKTYGLNFTCRSMRPSAGNSAPTNAAVRLRRLLREWDILDPQFPSPRLAPASAKLPPTASIGLAITIH